VHRFRPANHTFRGFVEAFQARLAGAGKSGKRRLGTWTFGFVDR
jgi:hypothetical protein